MDKHDKNILSAGFLLMTTAGMGAANMQLGLRDFYISLFMAGAVMMILALIPARR